MYLCGYRPMLFQDPNISILIDIFEGARQNNTFAPSIQYQRRQVFQRLRHF